MPETEQGSSDQKKSNDKEKRRSRGWLWLVFYGVLVLAGLSIGSWYFEKGADRAKFWVEGLLSAGVLSVVIVQAVIYRKQWNAMQEGLELSRESMRYSQSAYITVKDVVTSNEKMGEPLEFLIRFVNSGTTPAYKCRVYLHINNQRRPFKFSHEQAKNLKGMRISTAILGANGEIFHQRLHTAPVVLSPDLLATEAQMPIHIWGIVTYMDVFKRDRWTTFCYVRAPFRPQAEADTEGNEADGYG
jgi:hypothetical protein